MLLICARAGLSYAHDVCQSETFQPRCLPGDAVIITRAVYGRMSRDSRCLRGEEEIPTLRGDPKYTGCFEDVLPVVSARCSRQSDCRIRIPDPEMERSNPCYKNMIKYFVVTYRCITGKLLAVQLTNNNGLLYLSVTPKFYTEALHQTTGLMQKLKSH